MRSPGFDDLRLALHDAEPGAKVPAVVYRDGERESIEIRLGRPPRPLPTTPEFTVRLELDPKPSKQALAIRRSVFGDELR